MVLLGQDWLAGTGRRKQQAIRAMTATRLTKTGCRAWKVRKHNFSYESALGARKRGCEPYCWAVTAELASGYQATCFSGEKGLLRAWLDNLHNACYIDPMLLQQPRQDLAIFSATLRQTSAKLASPMASVVKYGASVALFTFGQSWKLGQPSETPSLLGFIPIVLTRIRTRCVPTSRSTAHCIIVGVTYRRIILLMSAGFPLSLSAASDWIQLGSSYELVSYGSS